MWWAEPTCSQVSSGNGAIPRGHGPSEDLACQKVTPERSRRLGHAGLAKDGLGLSPTGRVVGTSVPWLGPQLPAGSWNWRGHRMGGALKFSVGRQMVFLFSLVSGSRCIQTTWNRETRARPRADAAAGATAGEVRLARGGNTDRSDRPLLWGSQRSRRGLLVKSRNHSLKTCAFHHVQTTTQEKTTMKIN